MPRKLSAEQKKAAHARFAARSQNQDEVKPAAIDPQAVLADLRTAIENGHIDAIIDATGLSPSRLNKLVNSDRANLRPNEIESIQEALAAFDFHVKREEPGEEAAKAPEAVDEEPVETLAAHPSGNGSSRGIEYDEVAARERSDIEDRYADLEFALEA